jgi:hypothetical protein
MLAPYPDNYFLSRDTDVFLRPKPKANEKRNLKAKPIDKGNGWIEFVTTKYATREKRTRILVDKNDIANVEENYDLDEWKNRDWCVIKLKSGGEHQVYANYDELAKLLTATGEKKK